MCKPRSIEAVIYLPGEPTATGMAEWMPKVKAPMIWWST